jgi:FtsZ-binding cell division protein ZapB
MYDIVSLSEKNIQLTSNLEDCESRNNELENILREYEAKKVKQEQMVLQDQIGSLREELGTRKCYVEAANRNSTTNNDRKKRSQCTD